MIQHETQGDLSVITLDRAQKRNAMLPEMLEGLLAAIEASGDARAVVLIGAGKTFCAGFDLKACAADPSGETMRALLSGLSSCVRAMRACPAPVVLGVHGAAVAGGCALLGGADVVVAARDAKLGYPVVKIGVSPAVSSPFMLASMTPGVVRSRLVDTELVDGARAFELGMVHALVDTADEVHAHAMELGRSIAQKPGVGCLTTKRWLNEICEVTDSTAQQGLDASLSLTGGEEERARLAALWG